MLKTWFFWFLTVNTDSFLKCTVLNLSPYTCTEVRQYTHSTERWALEEEEEKKKEKEEENVINKAKVIITITPSL